MVVGDDDQSIYGWRGADIRNILDFEESFPAAVTVRLERNYRSTERILEAANHVIAENVNRKGKTLRTERVGGEPITIVESFDENDEGRWIVEEIETRVRDTPTWSYSSAAVLSVMAATGCRHVPVVDLDEKLVGIVGPLRVTTFLQDHYDNLAE